MSRVPKLHIHVIGAKCLTLRGKDVRSGTAVPEVFTVMEFGKEKFATRSVQCSKSCTWNEDAAFSMSLPTDEKRYVILKVLQKNPKVMSLEDDLFVGQIAVPLSEFLTTWDPSDSIIKKNNYPLTSKHGKTNKDRGFLEFKISFQNVGKQESAYQVPAFQLANKEGSVAGGSSVGNATPESQSQTSGLQDRFGSQASLGSSNNAGAAHTPSTPPRTQKPSSLNLNRADSTNSFDSSNRGHGAHSESLANTSSGRQSSQTGSTRTGRTGGLSRVSRAGSMRKKISMAEVQLSDDDAKSGKSVKSERSPEMKRNSNFNNSTTSGYNTSSHQANKTRLTVDGSNSLDRGSTPSPSGYKASGSGLNGNSNPHSNPALSSSSFKNSINNLRSNAAPFTNDYSGGEYSALNKEQLIDMVERQKGELSYRDDQVKKLEEYVDSLLMKIISINPEMLNHDFAPESSEVHDQLEKRHQEKKGPMKFLK